MRETTPNFIPYATRLSAQTEPNRATRIKFKVPPDYVWSPASRRLATMAGWERPRSSRLQSSSGRVC